MKEYKAEMFSDLSDIFIDNVSTISWALDVPEILIKISTIVTFTRFLIFHKYNITLNNYNNN